MEPKKTNKANLESKRNIFLQVGFVVTLSLVLLGFEWTTSTAVVNSLGNLAAHDIEDEMIPITRQEEIKPPPPPPKPPKCKARWLPPTKAPYLKECDAKGLPLPPLH